MPEPPTFNPSPLKSTLSELIILSATSLPITSDRFVPTKLSCPNDSSDSDCKILPSLPTSIERLPDLASISTYLTSFPLLDVTLFTDLLKSYLSFCCSPVVQAMYFASCATASFIAVFNPSFTHEGVEVTNGAEGTKLIPFSFLFKFVSSVISA